MKLRCMTRKDEKWVKEEPTDVSKWLWRHDGTESVAIDDENHTYYVGTPSMLTTYQEAWEKERRVNDQRKAAMFIELDRILYSQEVVA